MLSLAQALDKRGAAGLPLPVVYSRLHDAGCDICRSQLSLIVGPATSGKSTLAFNMVAKWNVPSLLFLLDTNELTASCRFLSILTGEEYLVIKKRIEDGEGEGYADLLAQKLSNIRVVFHAPDPEAVEREMQAYEQRYGLPPDVVLIDNLGNQASAYENEWAMLKSLTLELDRIARESQCAMLACAHTTDLISTEPARRTAILGKVSQYPRVILSVAYNAYNAEYKIAIVKNTEGPTDAGAEHPLTFWADMSRMRIEEDMWWTPIPPPPPAPAPLQVWSGSQVESYKD